MIYNEQQWEVIKQAGPHFRTARQDYIRNATRQMTEQIVDVYESATGKTIMSKDYKCAVCVLRIYQTIGKTYFSDLAEREELEKNKIEENAENNDNEVGFTEPDNGDKDKDTPDTGQDKKKLAKGRNSRVGKK